MKKQALFVFIIFLFSITSIKAQTAPEVTVTLNEQFMNSFLDAVFNNLETPKFQLAKKQNKVKAVKVKAESQQCDESITLLREANGVKTAIRFENGQIIAPLAFTGTKEVAFVGCSNFKGWAEAVLNLEYDREKQVLTGRVKVNKVDLNGIPGVASGLVARLVQSSIDSRINPVDILRAEQVSAIVPVKYANGSLRLRAVDMKPEVSGNALNVRVAFEFAKAN